MTRAQPVPTVRRTPSRRATHAIANAARAARWLLALATLLIVVWSFFDVATRLFRHTDLSGKVQLSVLHWGGPEEIQIAETLVRRYERDHPNVVIHRIHASDYYAKLRTMFSAGMPPDLFYLPPSMVAEAATLKLARPIDDLIARDRAAGNGAWFDD